MNGVDDVAIVVVSVLALVVPFATFETGMAIQKRYHKGVQRAQTDYLLATFQTWAQAIEDGDHEAVQNAILRVSDYVETEWPKH